MSVLIVGSTALDSIKTPKASNPRLLGGSASHAAVAASFFGPVRMVGVVGKDFPKRYLQLYERHDIDLAGLQIKPGKTFHWSGEYEQNMNRRRTLATELGVFETFSPELPASYRRSPYVLLANRRVIEDRIDRLVRYLGLAEPGFDGFLNWVMELREQVGIPNDLRALGIDDTQVDRIGRMAVEDPSAGTNPIQFSVDEYTDLVSRAVDGRLQA